MCCAVRRMITLVTQQLTSMHNATTSITVRLTHEQRHFLASQSAGFRRISDVVRDLIDQAMRQPSETLDKPCTLGGPTQEGLPSTSSSTVINSLPITEVSSLRSNSTSNSKINISSKSHVAEHETAATAGRRRRSKASTGTRVRVEYPEAFGLFWRQYLAIEKRASNQSKPKAFAAWSGVTKHLDPLSLQQCLTGAVNEQRSIERRGGFAAAFPDAFRWLRDGRWEAFLPSDTQRQPEASPRRFQGPLPSDPF